MPPASLRMHNCRISLGLSVTQPGDWSHSEAVSGCLAVLGCLTTARPRDFSIPDLSSENWKEEFPARHPSSHQQFEFYLIVIFGSVVKLVKLFMIQILQEIRKFSFWQALVIKCSLQLDALGPALSSLPSANECLFCSARARRGVPLSWQLQCEHRLLAPDITNCSQLPWHCPLSPRPEYAL